MTPPLWARDLFAKLDPAGQCKERSAGKWALFCPLHNDKHPSLHADLVSDATCGKEVATRFRRAIDKPKHGDDRRFCWKKGSSLCLYGLDRIQAARATGYVVIVEGESDCHTLWLHNIPAVGLPGAGN